MNAQSTNENPWPRIDAWLAVHAPATLGALGPPLDDEGIAAFAQAVGGALPPSLVEAYRAHDGAKGDSAAILGAVAHIPSGGPLCSRL